jgi:hypothetical protein
MVDTATKRKKLQFSLRSAFINLTLAIVAFQGAYFWHRFLLWYFPTDFSTDEGFVNAREWLYDTFTPYIAGFAIVGALGLWFGVSHRANAEARTAGVCLALPLFVFLAMPTYILSVVAMFYSVFYAPIAGVRLVARGRIILGALVVAVALAWLVFTYIYWNRWWDVYGD